MEFPKFKITLPGPTAVNGKIEMDGKLLHGVTRFKIESSCCSHNVLSVEFIPESIDVEIDACVVEVTRRTMDSNKEIVETTEVGNRTRHYEKTDKRKEQTDDRQV